MYFYTHTFVRSQVYIRLICRIKNKIRGIIKIVLFFFFLFFILFFFLSAPTFNLLRPWKGNLKVIGRRTVDGGRGDPLDLIFFLLRYAKAETTKNSLLPHTATHWVHCLAVGALWSGRLKTYKRVPPSPLSFHVLVFPLFCTCPLSPSSFPLPPPPPSHVPSQAPRAPQWALFHLSATLICISHCSSCFFISPLLPSPF